MINFTQADIEFQATTFQSKLSFVQAVKLLNKQETWKPERLCKDLNIYVSNYGLTFGYNKVNSMVILKGLDAKPLFTCTGKIGKHLFSLMIQKLRCK